MWFTLLRGKNKSVWEKKGLGHENVSVATCLVSCLLVLQHPAILTHLLAFNLRLTFPPTSPNPLKPSPVASAFPIICICVPLLSPTQLTSTASIQTYGIHRDIVFRTSGDANDMIWVITHLGSQLSHTISHLYLYNTPPTTATTTQNPRQIAYCRGLWVKPTMGQMSQTAWENRGPQCHTGILIGVLFPSSDNKDFCRGSRRSMIRPKMSQRCHS